jgi:hypothetical protein
MWEFWQVSQATDGSGWHAKWGGRLVNVSRSPGYYQNMLDASGSVLERPWWGAPASSLALAGGVITISDLQSGVIAHALSLGISHTCAGQWAAPAQRTDGDVTGDPTCVPEGAHFRLDPNLDLASLHLGRVAMMMAQAAQTYGIVINNRSNGFTFRAEDPSQFIAAYGYNPYKGPSNAPGSPGALFDQWPSTILQSFPWSHLQLVQMNVQTQADMTPVAAP